MRGITTTPQKMTPNNKAHSFQLTPLLPKRGRFCLWVAKIVSSNMVFSNQTGEKTFSNPPGNRHFFLRWQAYGVP